MEITIHERNTKVDQHVKDLAEDKLQKISRFVHDAERVEVDFIEQPSKKPTQRYICEVTVHCKKNFLKGHAEALDAGEALDKVVDKVEHQAQKLKSRRVSRFHPRKRDPKTHAMLPDLDFAELLEEQGRDEEVQVVKIKELDVKPMDIEEAILQMDLLGHDFFLFHNANEDRLSVLYRRKDGNLGVIAASA